MDRYSPWLWLSLRREKSIEIMRSQLLRLLVSIILIVFAVLLIQIAILFIGNYNLAKSWSEEGFEEFAQTLASAVDGTSITGEEAVLNLMVQKTSERIAGLILRDESGSFVFSLGSNGRGVPVPQSRSRMSLLTFQVPERLKSTYSSNGVVYNEVEIDPPRYEIAVSGIEELGIITEASFREIEDRKGKEIVSIPSVLRNGDIAGTIMITFNGVTKGYIDVIVYRFDYYHPTAFILREIVATIAISFPFAIIIAIILAFIVSRKNEQHVISIQNALSQLARGEYGVDMGKQDTDEFAAISDSIKALDSDLQRHRQSRKEWIRNISHDLNTPTASMSLMLDGALDGMFPLDRDLLCNMKKENDILSKRIASISYYSFLLSPDASVNKAAEDRMNWLDNVLQRLGARCRAVPSEGMIISDSKLSSRALEEVVKNAIQYSDPKDSPITVSFEDGDGYVDVAVTNHGRLPQPLPQFFEPWARGDSSRHEGGSGLGLPIASQIMEMHGGTISIGEEDGIVRVTLRFPCK